jgi:hypothetical protein
MQVAITIASGNSQTGAIPVTVTERASCPTTCPFFEKGCYGKYHLQGIHWRAVSDHKRGVSWDEFIRQVSKFAPVTLWRHNVTGDLPHVFGDIDTPKVGQIVKANKHKRGFTFTHHVLNDHNVQVIQDANARGFTINASTESVEVADQVMTEHGIPAVAVIPSTESRRFFHTESGRKVIVCPAKIHKGKVNCASCGLCQQSDREFIIAFPAHGTAKKAVDAIVTNG